jgi:hypothetical protein
MCHAVCKGILWMIQRELKNCAAQTIGKFLFNSPEVFQNTSNLQDFIISKTI